MKQFNFKSIFITLILLLSFSNFIYASSSSNDFMLDSNKALKKFYNQVNGSKEFLHKSKAFIIFPKITKGGFLFGGEYGEGVLTVDGKFTKQFYSISSFSLGFQAGLQQHSMIIAFLSERALNNFFQNHRLSGSIDGTLNIHNIKFSKDISSLSFENFTYTFVFNEAGLMGGLSLEGSKFNRIYPYY